jgi:hypothetical protein
MRKEAAAGKAALRAAREHWAMQYLATAEPALCASSTLFHLSATPSMLSRHRSLFETNAAASPCFPCVQLWLSHGRFQAIRFLMNI